MTDPIVSALGLTKRYSLGKGRTLTALDSLDLTVEAGEILGFLGPNGAGKTTTIRLLLGLLKPSAGSAKVLGHDCWRRSVEAKREIGYLPGDVRLYDGHTGRSFVELLMRLRLGPSGRPSLQKPALLNEVEELAERLDLDLSKKVRSYSKGNKQKLGFVQALMHRPRLLILDEPTSALDPLIQERVYEILRDRAREGATVFFSSHVLGEVQKVCDRVAILRKGRLMRLESVDAMTSFSARKVRLELKNPEADSEVLRLAGFEAKAAAGVVQFRFSGESGETDRLIKLLGEMEVTSLAIEPLNLEEVFFEFYRDEPEGSDERSGGSSVPKGGLV